MQKLFVSLLLTAAGSLGVLALGGCPIYSGDSGTASTCVGSGCVPAPGTCAVPSDCPSGESCGNDGACHTSDCNQSGCPNGYSCHVSNGAASCTANGGPGPLPVPLDAGPSQAPDSSVVPGKKASCATDAQCVAAAADAGAGARCLEGECVGAADQCSDSTQCKDGGVCVNGACTPPCDATHACPAGYACDTAKKVCSAPTTGCTSDGACGAGQACVESRCVAGCTSGGACGTGLVCVAGGCVAEEKPNFVCSPGGPNCAAGSTCVHHSCYIGCDPASATACKSADKYNQCKTVSTSSGPVNVCGSTTNLGSECDPTQNRVCASGKACIDGFCR